MVYLYVKSIGYVILTIFDQLLKFG